MLCLGGGDTALASRFPRTGVAVVCVGADGRSARADGSVAMRVEVTNPSHTDDLVAFLRRCDCTVEVVAPGLVEVEPRELPIDHALRRPELEVEAYLGIWSALRGARAFLVS
jgi:hypothetical protein